MVSWPERDSPRDGEAPECMRNQPGPETESTLKNVDQYTMRICGTKLDFS